MTHFFTFLFVITFASIIASSWFTSAEGLSTNQTLPDLSGIAWIEDDTFPQFMQ